MANQVFHWVSTYCECAVDVEGQDATPANLFQRWAIRVTHKCSRHASLPDEEVIGLLEAVALEFSATNHEDDTFEEWADEQVWRQRQNELAAFAAVDALRLGMEYTRWSPDTCKCVVEYKWDNTHHKVKNFLSEGYSEAQVADMLNLKVEVVSELAGKEEVREHILHKVVAKCKRHANMPDAEVYARLTEENPRKNRVRELILNSVPSVAVQRMQENGEATIDFHPKKPFVYEFDANHVLHVTVTGITAATRKKIQKSADAAHGASKVVIH